LGFGDQKRDNGFLDSDQRDMTALVREELRQWTTMVNKAGGHKWLQQIGKMLEKTRRCKHCDMKKYCDTSEKLARCVEKFKLPNANIYLARYT
jgi:hypothetical protein